MPDQVTYEGISSIGGQSDEHHNRSRRVAGCRDDHDRAIAIQVAGLGEAQIGTAVERVLLETAFMLLASAVAQPPSSMKRRSGRVISTGTSGKSGTPLT